MLEKYKPDVPSKEEISNLENRKEIRGEKESIKNSFNKLQSFAKSECEGLITVKPMRGIDDMVVLHAQTNNGGQYSEPAIQIEMSITVDEFIENFDSHYDNGSDDIDITDKDELKIVLSHNKYIILYGLK